jgi:hypothetical protein
MNLFRLAGDMTHLISIMVLLLKIHTIRSCRGTPPRSLRCDRWSVLTRLCADDRLCGLAGALSGSPLGRHIT